MTQKATDPTKIVTDSHIARLLTDQRVEISDVEFLRDYSVADPTTKIYRNTKNGLNIASCQGLPKVNADGIKICGNNPNETTVGWQKKNGLYRAKPNVFTCSVDGIGVELVSLGSRFTKRGLSVGWEPRVYLNGVEQHCGSPTVLLIDPTNPNYSQNVLEWDYGICKRRLRVIEGALLGRWIFTENPNGEVRIKYNQTGDLKLTLGEFAISDDEEIIPPEAFDEAEFPFEIGDSLTVYSTASDGHIRYIDAVYATAHDAANGEVITAAAENLVCHNSLLGGDYYVYRGFPYFDTSALGATAIISAATLTLFGKVGGYENDLNHPDLGIVEGVQDDPLALDDFGDHLLKTTLGADSYYSYDAWNENDAAPAANDKALNATGIGWISKTATTKFCLRTYGDMGQAAGFTPTAGNRVLPFANEKGAGFIPKLVITYRAVVIEPAPATMVLATVNPTVILGSITITPSPATMVLATVNPTVKSGTLVIPAPATMGLAIVDPTVLIMNYWAVGRTAKPLISVKLYDRNLTTPVFVENLTPQFEGLQFSTKLSGGFNSCSFTLKKNLCESWKWMTERAFYRLVVEHNEKTLFEGRVEDRSIEAGQAKITAYGYYANLTDIPYNTAYNTVASTIVKAILTAACLQIDNTDHTHIDTTDITIDSAADTSYADIYPQPLIEKLLAFSDSANTGKWYFAIWEDRIPYMFERSVTSVDWLVNLGDLARFRLTHRGADLWNACYAVYGVAPRTGDADDTASQDKYGDGTNPFERKYVIPSLGAVAQASAEAARDAWLTEHAEIYPKLEEIVLGGTVYNSNGVPYPSCWVRAGEVIRVRDLVPASQTLDSVVRDALRTFYIVETNYNADSNTNRLVVDTESTGLDAILARRL